MGCSTDQPLTILLIEDEPLIRMATAAMLEDGGNSVLEADDAESALCMLEAHAEIDVVITDVQMPGKIDGLALVEVVRRDYPHVRSLVTSGRSCLQDAKKCGATGFLAKPYTALAIHSALQTVLVSS